MATDKPRFLVTPTADLKKEWEDAAKESGKSLSKWVIDMVQKARSMDSVVEEGSAVAFHEDGADKRIKGDHGYYEKEVVTPVGNYIQLEIPLDEEKEDVFAGQREALDGFKLRVRDACKLKSAKALLKRLEGVCDQIYEDYGKLSPNDRMKELNDFFMDLRTALTDLRRGYPAGTAVINLNSWL